MSRRTALVVPLALMLTAGVVNAHEYYAADFTLIHPWADASAPGAQTAPVYFKLEGVRAPDRLLRADSPHAERVELRENDEPSTPALTDIAITPADALEFRAGRPHLLLCGLKAPLQWGRSYQMTMVFEKAGAIQVMVSIGAH